MAQHTHGQDLSPGLSLLDTLADSMRIQRWLPSFPRCRAHGYSQVGLAAGGTMAPGAQDDYLQMAGSLQEMEAARGKAESLN